MRFSLGDNLDLFLTINLTNHETQPNRTIGRNLRL